MHDVQRACKRELQRGTPVRLREEVGDTVAGWECSECAHTNGPNDPQCTACGATRLRGATGDASSVRRAADASSPGWRCGDCETVNASAAELCSACGASRSRAVDIGSSTAIGESTVVVTRTGMASRAATPRPPAPSTRAGTSTGTDPVRSESTGSRRLRPLIAVGCVVVVLLLVLIAVLIRPKHSSVTFVPALSTPATAAAGKQTPATSTVQSTPAAEAQSLNSLVSTSADQRTNVVNAAGDLEQCGNPQSDQNGFSQAASTRQSVVNQLGGLQLSLIPNYQQLVQDLTSGLDYSIQSDNSYAQWAGDEITNCSTDYNNDANFLAAQQTDPQANAAKLAFTNLWNPIAQQYGLPTWDPTKI